MSANQQRRMPEVQIRQRTLVGVNDGEHRGGKSGPGTEHPPDPVGLCGQVVQGCAVGQQHAQQGVQFDHLAGYGGAVAGDIADHDSESMVV